MCANYAGYIYKKTIHLFVCPSGLRPTRSLVRLRSSSTTGKPLADKGRFPFFSGRLTTLERNTAINPVILAMSIDQHAFPIHLCVERHEFPPRWSNNGETFSNEEVGGGGRRIRRSGPLFIVARLSSVRL